jgi:hypothetical protein
MTGTSNRIEQRTQTPELDDAIAALIINTRRIKRKLSLLEIAEKIEIARKYLSANEIASKLSLSKEMIREFSRVNHLAPPVKNMIKKGIITSIDIADRLSRLPLKDQTYVAKETTKGNLKSEDLRAIVVQRKIMPEIPIAELVARIVDSRNIKDYVAEFPIPLQLMKDINLVRRRIITYFGMPHVRSFRVEPQGVARIQLDEVGKRRLISGAKDNQASKGEMLQIIIHERKSKNA